MSCSISSVPICIPFSLINLNPIFELNFVELKFNIFDFNSSYMQIHSIFTLKWNLIFTKKKNSINSLLAILHNNAKPKYKNDIILCHLNLSLQSFDYHTPPYPLTCMRKDKLICGFSCPCYRYQNNLITQIFQALLPNPFLYPHTCTWKEII